MMLRVLRWVAIAALVAVAPAVRGAEPVDTAAEARPEPIRVPSYAIAPETAATISGVTLVAGVAAGSILLASSVSGQGVDAPLPGSIVIATTLVLAPSLGRWLGGDTRTAAIRTGTRLLLAGAASAAAYYGFGEGGGTPRVIGLVMFSVLTPIVVAAAITDVAGTSRDLRLNRAVEALTISRSAQGAPVIGMVAPF